MRWDAIVIYILGKYIFIFTVGKKSVGKYYTFMLTKGTINQQYNMV